MGASYPQLARALSRLPRSPSRHALMPALLDQVSRDEGDDNDRPDDEEGLAVLAVPADHSLRPFGLCSQRERDAASVQRAQGQPRA